MITISKLTKADCYLCNSCGRKAWHRMEASRLSRAHGSVVYLCRKCFTNLGLALQVGEKKTSHAQEA